MLVADMSLQRLLEHFSATYWTRSLLFAPRCQALSNCFVLAQVIVDRRGMDFNVHRCDILYGVASIEIIRLERILLRVAAEHIVRVSIRDHFMRLQQIPCIIGNEGHAGARVT